MPRWTVAGLWWEGRAVPLACDALRQFGAAVVPVPSPDPPVRDGATPGSGPVDPAVLDGDAGAALLAELADVDALLVDVPWAGALSREGAAARPQRQVRCEVVPWAAGWSWAAAPALDLCVQAAGGIATSNGYHDDPPVRAGVPLADVGTALASAAGVLAALLDRDRDGAGGTVRVHGEHVMASYLTTLLPRLFIERREPPRVGNRHAMTAPWNTYRTREGWIVISTMGDHLWVRLAALMGSPGHADDPRFATADARVRNVDALDAVIEAWTATLGTGEAVRALTGAGVPAAPLPGLTEVFADEHVRERNLPHGPGRVPRLRHGTRSPSGGAGAAPGRSGTGSPGGRPPGATGALPLEGVRVLELGAFTAGPLAAKILGYLGADVVKVEPPGGDNCRHLAQQVGGASYLYHLNNTDKRSVVLDLTSSGGREHMQALAREADVYVTNLALPTLEKLGATPADLASANPALVACAITGYGLEGARSHERAFDSVAQAVSGVMGLTGFPGGPPLKTAVSMADLLGAWTGVVAVLAALGEEPRGRVVDVALQDAALWAVHAAWQEWSEAGLPLEAVTRQGNRHPSMAPHGCYPTADGHVALAARDEQEWARLAAAVPGCDDMAGWPLARRLERVDVVDAAVSRWTGAQDRAGVVAALAPLGIPVAPVRSLGEVAAAARETGLLVDQRLAGGEPILGLRVPLVLAATHGRDPAVAPALGSARPRWNPRQARSDT